MGTTLREWLGSLDEERLATLLRLRPEVLRPSPPRDINDLGVRLGAIDWIVEAARRLPSPAATVMQALLALGADGVAGVARSRLAALVEPEDAAGTPPGDADAALDSVVAGLVECGMAWPGDGDRIHVVPAVRTLWRMPLLLGRPAMDFLVTVGSTQLAKIARALGMSTVGNKRQLQQRIIDFLADPVAMGRLVSRAPAETREFLELVATHGALFRPDFDYFSAGYLPAARRPAGYAAISWAQERGLVWLADYSGVFEMPCEVGLALRGPEYRVRIAVTQPEVATVEVDPEGLEHESAAAALRLLDQYDALLTTAGATKVALLKAGGVGVRELRRLAAAARCTEDEARLYLELAEYAGMLDTTRAGTALQPTPGFAAWQRGAPAERLATLYAAWGEMASAPLRDIGEGKRRVPFTHDDFGLSSRDARWAALRTLAELPARAAPSGLPTLLAAVGWRCPMIGSAARDTEIVAALDEARLLGLCSGLAATGVGRALAECGPGAHAVADVVAPAGCDDLVAAAEKLLNRASGQALFGADLTAVVTGAPSPELTALLDGAADRESRDTASTWRFGPASVRRALDAGQSAAGLLAALGEVAQSELPQTLRYLVEDVGRRHGHMQVTAVACCVVSDQPALLAEAAVHRKLAALQLRQLAPTVLASALPVDRTLAALREAGYLPVAPDQAGVVALARAETPARAPRARRTPVPRQARTGQHRNGTSDVAEIAGRLLRARPPSGRRAR